MDACAELVDEALEEADVDRAEILGAGLGLPGPIHRATGQVGSAAILPGWAGLQVADEVQRRLGLPVHVDNDANLGALAELFWGAGQGSDSLVYLKVATGIGAGLVFDRRLYYGAGGTAGRDRPPDHRRERPHLPLRQPGVPRDLRRRSGDRGAASKQPRQELTIEEVVERAIEGDPGCRRAIADAGRHVGHAVAALCNLFNPERVVVGGSVGQARELLLAEMRDAVRRWAIASAAADVEIVAGVLGERAEVLGAVALVLGGARAGTDPALGAAGGRTGLRMTKEPNRRRRGMFRGSRTGAAALAAAALMAGGVIAGCGDDDEGGGGGSGGGGGGGGSIALLLPESKTARYESQDRPNFERKVKELCSDCEIIYSNADQDAAKQQQQAEAALTQGAKVMVLDPVDAASAGAIVQRAKQQQVPVISYDRLITDADIDYYISFDNEQVGKLQGETLVKKLKEEGKDNATITMINGAPTDNNAKLFKQGAKSVFTSEGVKIGKEYDTPDWSPDKAQQEMEQAITALGDDGFDAAYAANDGTAGGAIAAMKSAGIDPATRFVTGQDAELAAIQRILAGEQFMTVYKAIIPEAEAAAEIAVALAQGKEPPADLVKDKIDNGQEEVPSVLLTPVAVTKENIQDTIIKDGFWKASEVCTGKYAAACKEAGVQ